MAADDVNDIEEIEEETDIVELQDEDGNVVAFAVLLVVELDGQDYAALTPVTQLDGDDGEEQDIYLFAYDETEDEDGIVQSFSPIEDEATFAMVSQFCESQMAVLSDA